MPSMGFIRLNSVNLKYSSLAFRETSLKALVFRMMSRGKWMGDKADIHALKNISFQINRGERVGIIGRNGAGKTTLLKCIAGLYPISSGEIETEGEIRTLLELNLGFESEATGRENIFYRGLILGKTPKEIRAMEPEILEFVELGNFIDYPIKTYSAGMGIRLAFGIATAAAGDILLLDEVLGAGDVGFFKKAKGRIMQMINGAEIVLFASHDLGAIREICNRVLVLQRGELVYDGGVEEGIALYMRGVVAS